MKSRVPKVLHKICGREMVSLVVQAAKEAGLDPIIVVVPENDQSIRECLGPGPTYIVQANPLGTGHALLSSRKDVPSDHSIVVLNGDMPLIRPDTIRALIKMHNSTRSAITMLTSNDGNTNGMGRIVRDSTGSITAVVEDKQATGEVAAITEVNAGLYCIQTPWVWDCLQSLTTSKGGEIYLTSLVDKAVYEGLHVESITSMYPHETRGVNSRVDLAHAEDVLRHQVRHHWMQEGVTMIHPDTTYIDTTVCLDEDITILPNSHLVGDSVIGKGCIIGPNTTVSNSVLGDGCKVVSSVIEGSILMDDVEVGPFSHVRPRSHLGQGVRIGNHAEIKNSVIGNYTKSGHFSYIGDAEVGANVNIGAGTITCNYDGKKKNRTVVGDDVFIGCDTMLVAPVSVGPRATTGTNSVVNRDVPSDSRAIGAPARIFSNDANNAKRKD